MDVAKLMHEYNMEVIRLRGLQVRTRKMRVKKKLENRILKLKVKAVKIIREYYILSIAGGCAGGDFIVIDGRRV